MATVKIIIWICLGVCIGVFGAVWFYGPAQSPAAYVIQSRLLDEGYFIPKDVGYTSSVFFCVCGPYQSCRKEAEEVASRVNYKIPSFEFEKGQKWPRQKIVYFLPSEVKEIIVYHGPIFAREFESYCDVNLSRKVLRIEGKSS
jgi:hypothetical protein